RGQPGRGLVRAAQGLSRPVRDVRAAAARSAGPGGAGAQRTQQPRAGALNNRNCSLPVRRRVTHGAAPRALDVAAVAVPVAAPVPGTVTDRANGDRAALGVPLAGPHGDVLVVVR